MEDQLSRSLFQPLVIFAILFAVAQIGAAFMRARGSAQTADRILDLGFGVVLLAAAWTAVLLLISIFSEGDQVYDIVLILLVIGVFFVLLLSLFFVIFELLPSLLRRKASKQK